MQLRKVGKTVMHSLIIIMLIVGLYVQTAQAAIQATTNASVTIILTIDSKTYSKNGENLSLDIPPYISQDNRTMVPIRFIAEGFGAKVTWVDTQKTDIIELNNKIINCKVGETLPDNMGTPVIKNDRLFVPIRYIATSLGADVNWDAKERKVIITMNQPVIIPVYRSDYGQWGCGTSDVTGLLDKGFTAIFKNVSTDKSEAFQLIEYNGDDSFYLPYFSESGIGFQYFPDRVKITNDFQKVLDDLNHSIRVYINDKLVTGTARSEDHSHKDNSYAFGFAFNRIYLLSEVDTIRIELGIVK